MTQTLPFLLYMTVAVDDSVVGSWPFAQGSAMALHRMRAHGLRGKGLGYVNGKHSRETETQEQGGDDAEDE
jgi:hypothetical protein